MVSEACSPRAQVSAAILEGFHGWAWNHAFLLLVLMEGLVSPLQEQSHPHGCSSGPGRHCALDLITFAADYECPLTDEDLGEAKVLGTELAPCLSIWEKSPQPRATPLGGTIQSPYPSLHLSLSLQDPVLSQVPEGSDYEGQSHSFTES